MGGTDLWGAGGGVGWDGVLEPKLPGGPGLGGQSLRRQPIPTAILACFASHLHSTPRGQTWAMGNPKGRGDWLRAGPRLGPHPET